MMNIAAMAVLSGLSLNLFLQFALGISHLTNERDKTSTDSGFSIYSSSVPFIQFVCLFISITVFWSLYYFIIKFLSGGFLEYFLIFPLSSLLCMGTEAGAKKIIKDDKKGEAFNAFSAPTGYDGLAAVSFLLVINSSARFFDGIIHAFFLVFGCILVSFILTEIKRRALLEKVPHLIAGPPLTLIAMGLLSIIFAAVAAICFK